MAEEVEEGSLEEPQKGLRFELHGVEGEGMWFRLYECEHVTEGSYPPREGIPIGDHANLLLCRHCWEHLKGRLSLELLTDALSKAAVEELRTSLSSPRICEGELQSASSRDNLINEV